MRQEGITLIELIIVVAIIGILATVAGFEVNNWITRYRAETHVKDMYADMSSARQRAMHKNVQHLIVLSAKGYLICEDSNGNNLCDSPSETTDSPVSRALSKNNLRFQINWNLSGSANTVVMDRKGMLSPVTPGGSSIWLVKPGAAPLWDSSEVDTDCLSIHETRIRMGKFNGTACQPK
jgi:prepilin-type N-terminal cleavage/methylation domain-containing protein